jgi:hypothetical protein
MEIIGKIGRENRKLNELGFQEMAAILSPLSIYGDSQKSKLPILHKTRIHAPEGHFGNILVVAQSDGCPATTPCLASTQALRSRCVSSASKLLGAPGSRLHPPSLGSSGPHVRSGRPTNRSAGLQMGRTHLSGTATSLVGGDLGVPMSHNSTSSSH